MGMELIPYIMLARTMSVAVVSSHTSLRYIQLVKLKQMLDNQPLEIVESAMIKSFCDVFDRINVFGGP